MKKTKNQYIAPKILYENTFDNFEFDEKSKSMGSYFKSGIAVGAILIIFFAGMIEIAKGGFHV